MKSNRKILVIALLLLLISFSVVVWSRWSWEQKQANIHVTPELAIQTFEDAGCSISNIHEVDEYPGPMGIPLYAIEMDLYKNGKVFSVLLASYNDDWRMVSRGADLINELDERMKGGYSYAFSHGTLLVQIYPSDKSLGRNLISILKTIE